MNTPDETPKPTPQRGHPMRHVITMILVCVAVGLIAPSPGRSAAACLLLALAYGTARRWRQ